LTVVLVEWSASFSGRFNPGEKFSGIQWIGGWVGYRAGLDEMEKGKFFTKNLLGGKGRPARKADNLTAICETIV
jgi:hypothetical protein